jgi:thiamine thiazole synthase
MNPREISALREKEITRTIAREHFAAFEEMVESDVIIVGGGPSGLVCAKELASSGIKTLLIEQQNHLGGGFWNGGFLMNKAAIAHPAQEILLKLGVPCKETGRGMYIVDPPHATARLVSAVYEAGARVLNMTTVVDLIVRGESSAVEGVVVNWTALEAMGHDAAHVDPIALESKVVVDATGHDAATLGMLVRRKLVDPIPGNGAMWVERSEEDVMQKTGEVYPNLFVIGLAVAAVFGTPRMGPAFGAMLLSGKKGAELIRMKLGRA